MNDIQPFIDYLREEEKSSLTIEKYHRDVKKFLAFCENEGILVFSKEVVIRYRKWLQEEHYKDASVNSMIIAVNQYMCFLGREDCVVEILKTQEQMDTPLNAQLTREDYTALLNAAFPNRCLYTMLQTFAGTGIRVSELAYFTVEAVQKGCIKIPHKGNIHEIVLQTSLRDVLLDYAKSANLTSGPIFRTSKGKPIERYEIWIKMKRLCKEAGVAPEKVYPNNFRKLFARTVYNETHDLSLLANLLGHSSLDTTRIYIHSKEKRQAQLDRMNLF